MEHIRNFCIISHIDHGKSTLADRFLEMTGTIKKEKMKPQFLDMMDLEREKGITIKMQPVRMIYKDYILNLIDTPGHVDFSYEVSRSLAAVEGAILLVDATKGVQAQTLANLELARAQKLVIIPAVNKIDSPQARVEETKEEMAELLDISKEDIYEISGKYGKNIEQLLEAVIEKVPAPKGNLSKPLRALIFDSQYDFYKGVIAYVRVIDGRIQKGKKIHLIQAQKPGEVKELGYFLPQKTAKEELKAGEIGYLATNVKEAEKVRVGETITDSLIEKVEPLPGYRESKPMVFASFYPENPIQFDLLKDSLGKLKLSDAALTYEPEMKESLGRGFRCGFLGTLHAEIISERLHREFGLDLVISTPSVVFEILQNNGRRYFIYSASDWPDPVLIDVMQEPWAKLEVLTPLPYMGNILELLEKTQGKQVETKYFGQDLVFLIYEVALREIISGFYDNLKGVSQGYASMNYELIGYRPAKLVKLDILVAGEKEEALSKIVPELKAEQEGRKIVKKLKETLPSQLFSVPLQATISGKVIARETLRAKGKDVIAPLYGGDYTRKKKLLEKQKKGKKELKARGQVRIPQKVFLEMFRG